MDNKHNKYTTFLTKIKHILDNYTIAELKQILQKAQTKQEARQFMRLLIDIEKLVQSANIVSDADNVVNVFVKWEDGKVRGSDKKLFLKEK